MDNQLARIYHLKSQLRQLGYHGFQVEAMQREVIGGSAPEDVEAEKRKILIEAFERYAYFALKARSGARRIKRRRSYRRT